MKTFTIGNVTVDCETAEDLHSFTKVELMNYCMDNGAMLKGKASKEEFAAHIFNAEPATAEPATADNTPGPNNAPAGMVFCKNCQKHVSKGKTVPTSVINEYICLMGCKKATGTATGSSLANKAKVASVKPVKEKKESTGVRKNTNYNDTDIITGIQWQPKTGSNSSKTVALMTIGMAVGTYIKLVDEMNARGECGTIKGRSDFAYHLKLNHVTITAVVTAAQ